MRQVKAPFDEALPAGGNPNFGFGAAVFRAIKGWKGKASSALIDQNDFVFLMQGRFQPEIQIGRRRVARSAGQMEDGRIFRLSPGRYAQDKKIDPAPIFRRLTILWHQCPTAAELSRLRAGALKNASGTSHRRKPDHGLLSACFRQKHQQQQQQTEASLAHKRSIYAKVRIRGPSSVIATVCSKWAVSEPSFVTTVQPSSNSTRSGRPAISIGSMA